MIVQVQVVYLGGEGIGMVRQEREGSQVPNQVSCHASHLRLKLTGELRTYSEPTLQNIPPKDRGSWDFCPLDLFSDCSIAVGGRGVGSPSSGTPEIPQVGEAK